jgi:indolepyruvate ferredoxin oxidoreductase beta subunit
MGDITNFVLVGVGGQGIILASTIISEAAVLKGFDVKNNEVHGMAQRGGSVISQIRFGEEVYSPLAGYGTAHFMIALEKLEALRYIYMCNEETKLIINDVEIVPITVTSGAFDYPIDIDTQLTSHYKHIQLIDAQRIARHVGSIRTANVVLIGAMSNYLPIEDTIFEKAITNSVKKDYIDMNIDAFYRGKEAVTLSHS